MIEKFDWKNFNLFKWLKLGDIDVLALSDVQKHTIKEKKKRFNIKMLTPA